MSTSNNNKNTTSDYPNIIYYYSEAPEFNKSELIIKDVSSVKPNRRNAPRKGNRPYFVQRNIDNMLFGCTL